MSRGCLVGLLAWSLGGCAGSPAAAPPTSPTTEVAERFPRDAARFAVQPVNDSTIAFAPAEANWVRAGMVGVAVDPARGDALVGRLRVVAVRDGRAEALVTGQITRLSTSHVLLLVPPPVAWWRRGNFWWGAAVGAATMGIFTIR